MKRPGYYVEGRHFRDNFHQARARAAHLAKEFSRPIPIMFVAHEPTDYPNVNVAFEVSRIYNTVKEEAA